MPELPEVETVLCGLEPVLVGQKLVRVDQRRENLRFPFPDRFVQRLEGQTIVSMTRRAKYLLAELSSGEVLVMHLGMSGRFTIVAAEQSDTTQTSPGEGVKADDGNQPGQFVHDAGCHQKHDHVVFQTEAGATVTYNDARRFGYMLLIDAATLEQHRLFAGLGPEPLGNEFNAGCLALAAQGRKTNLKSFLLDQHVVAGLGNIYVCEALYRAGLSPDRTAATLSSKAGKPLRRCEDLVAAIRAILEAAIAAGGSSLRDYKQTDGSLGYFQHAFQVYGRENEACWNADCTGTIKRKVHGGRSTFYCPRCQK